MARRLEEGGDPGIIPWLALALLETEPALRPPFFPVIASLSRESGKRKGGADEGRWDGMLQDSSHMMIAVESLDTLCRCLRTPLRERCANAIASVDHPSAVPSLARLLEQDPDPTVRTAAAIGLTSRLDGQQSGSLAPLLQEALTDPFLPVRNAAIRAVVNMGGTDARDSIARVLLMQEEDSVNPNLLKAAGELRMDESRPLMLELLQHHDHSVRSAAAWTLGELGAREASGGMIQNLSSRNSNDRRVMVEALHRLRAIESIPHLAALAREDPDPSIRYLSARVLEDLVTHAAHLPALSPSIAP